MQYNIDRKFKNERGLVEWEKLVQSKKKPLMGFEHDLDSSPCIIVYWCQRYDQTQCESAFSVSAHTAEMQPPFSWGSL